MTCKHLVNDLIFDLFLSSLLVHYFLYITKLNNINVLYLFHSNAYKMFETEKSENIFLINYKV